MSAIYFLERVDNQMTFSMYLRTDSRVKRTVRSNKIMRHELEHKHEKEASSLQY
jgi:hypothetical protein